jgi:gamma-glutamyl-gamma-aminobutyrate hydrolase PuuD
MQIGIPSKRPLYGICRGLYLCCVVNAGKLMRVRCSMSVVRNPNCLNIKSSAYNEMKTGYWRHAGRSARITGAVLKRGRKNESL